MTAAFEVGTKILRNERFFRQEAAKKQEELLSQLSLAV